MMRDRNHELRPDLRERLPFALPKEVGERRSQLFRVGLFCRTAHPAERRLINSQPDHALKMKTIPLAVDATASRIEKRTDRRTTAPTAIVFRRNGLSLTRFAQMGQHAFESTPRMVVRAAIDTSRGRDETNHRTEQTVHGPTAALHPHATSRGNSCRFLAGGAEAK
jgi:hypothetical protein